MLKQVLKRTFILFIASACITAILTGLLWWHHASVAGQCNASLSAGDSITCYCRTTFFGDWSFIAVLAGVYLVVCLFVVLLWGWAKRKFRAEA